MEHKLVLRILYTCISDLILVLRSITLSYGSYTCIIELIDECLKHSSYTRVGSSFSRLFYRNFIVFVARSLIFCLVWLQVQWSEKSSY